MATATIETGQKQLRQFIGGDWVDAAGGGTFPDRSPFTGGTFATAPAGTGDDARRAIDAAARAFPTWAATPPVARQQVFLKAADILERRGDEVVRALAEETGCGFGLGMFQMNFVPGLFRQAAGLAYAPTGTIIPSDVPGTFAMGIRRPVGVVAAIAPWNAALILSARAIAAPLVAGNSVVLKPSQESPFCGGLVWAEIFAQAGLPPGVLNVVTHAPGDGAKVGDEFATNPLVRRINFTGSTETGRKIAEAAGRNLKRVVLELGGSNPLIVLRDADLEYAVNATTFGAYFHQGQICMSTRRVFVEEPIAREFTDRLAAKVEGLRMGDPRDPDVVIGPLINGEALDIVRRRVDEAVGRGAKVLAGGRADGPCYAATLLTDVPDDAEIAMQETFGPVALIETVANEDDAVARANDTSYGLSSGIITTDTEKGLALAERIEAGIVHVNDQTVGDEPQMPFGGVKDSGWGRFGGTHALEEFTELKWVTVQSGSHPFPF
jgi:acyl-CoA reductase-like NAD-dependent aldehyde dehydrogenase